MTVPEPGHYAQKQLYSKMKLHCHFTGQEITKGIRQAIQLW